MCCLTGYNGFCVSGSDCLTLGQSLKITIYVWQRERLILPQFDSGTGLVFSLWCLIIPNQAYMYIGSKLHFPCFSSLSQPYEQAFYYYGLLRPHKKKKNNGITHFQSPDINHPVCGQVVNTLNSGCEGPGFQGSSLTCCVVSLDRELYSTFSLFT